MPTPPGVPSPPSSAYGTPPPYGSMPPYGMPAPRPSTTNGMAIASLVLGIVTFVCLGPIAGVLAIVFGVLGLKKAKEIGTGRGMSIAGIVLGAVGSLVVIVAFIALVASSDGASSRFDEIDGPANTDNYEITLDRCEIDEYGEVTFTGTIRNTADRDLNFDMTGEIRSTDGGLLLDSPTDYVEVPEGDTAQWNLDTYLDEPEDITCKVTSVDNFFN